MTTEDLKKNVEKALKHFEGTARLSSPFNMSRVGLVDGLPVIATDEFAGIWFPVFEGIGYDEKARPIDIPEYRAAVNTIEKDYHLDAVDIEHIRLYENLTLVMTQAKHNVVGDVYSNHDGRMEITVDGGSWIGLMKHGTIPVDKSVGVVGGVRIDIRPLQAISELTPVIYFTGGLLLNRNGIRTIAFVDGGVIVFYFRECSYSEPAVELYDLLTY